MSEVIQGNKTIIEGKENTTSQEESRKKGTHEERILNLEHSLKGSYMKIIER